MGNPRRRLQPSRPTTARSSNPKCSSTPDSVSQLRRLSTRRRPLVAQLVSDAVAVELALFTSALELDEIRNCGETERELLLRPEAEVVLSRCSPTRQTCAIPKTGRVRAEPADSNAERLSTTSGTARFDHHFPDLVPTHGRGRRPPRRRSTWLLLPPKRNRHERGDRERFAHGCDSRADRVAVTAGDPRIVGSVQPTAADRRPRARGVAPPRGDDWQKRAATFGAPVHCARPSRRLISAIARPSWSENQPYRPMRPREPPTTLV